MNRIEITNGSRKVIASRNDASSRWNANLYVNNGETITNIRNTFASEKGLRKWASNVLSR